MQNLDAPKVLLIAAGLLSDQLNPNPEYDRAILELTSDLLGVDEGHRDLVEASLTLYREVQA